MSILPQLEHDLYHAARQRHERPERSKARQGSEAHGEPSVAQRRHVRRLPIGGVLTAAGSALVIVVALGALILLGSHRAPSTAGVPSTSARQQLLQTLGVLRAPPTAADRKAIACAKSPPKPPSLRFRSCRFSGLPPAFSHPVGSRALARWGYPRLDSTLIRIVAIPQFQASVTLAPATWQPSPRSQARTEGIIVSISYARGATGTGPEPTPVATVETHGLAVSDGNATPQMRSVIGAVIVPDHVARVTLQPIRIVSPPAAIDPARFRTATSNVHDNVAVFRFPVLSAANPRRMSALYGMTVIARAIWFDRRSQIIDRTTSQLFLSVRVHGKGNGANVTNP